MELELEVFGDVQLKRSLLRTAGRFKDAAPAFEQIADILMEIEDDQFESSGRHGSGGWAKLAESTLEHKTGAGILIETGDLERSLTTRGAPDQVLEITSEFLLFGTSLPYAAFHQTGTSRMPRRRPIELTETDRRQIVKQLQSWLITGDLLPHAGRLTTA